MSKPRKKQNALKHGAHVPEVMLWNEKYEDYEALRAELYLEFAPSGSMEEYLVEVILDLRWRRRRLDRFERAIIQKRLDKIRETNEISRHIENLRSLASLFNQATSVEKVEALFATLSTLYKNIILRDWPLRADEDPNAWGLKIAKGLFAWKVPPRHEQADEFIATINPEEFYPALARIERLDLMIDRAVKRLMQ